jgi:hypothetical protein
MEAAIATIVGALIAAISTIAVAVIQGNREPNSPRISRLTFWQSIAPPFGMGLFWSGSGIVMAWQDGQYFMSNPIPWIAFFISSLFFSAAYRRFVKALGELELNSKSKISK